MTPRQIQYNYQIHIHNDIQQQGTCNMPRQRADQRNNATAKAQRGNKTANGQGTWVMDKDMGNNQRNVSWEGHGAQPSKAHGMHAQSDNQTETEHETNTSRHRKSQRLCQLQRQTHIQRKSRISITYTRRDISIARTYTYRNIYI